MNLDLILPAYNAQEGWEKYAFSRISGLSSAWATRHSDDPLSVSLFIVPDASKTGHSAEVRAFWEKAAILVQYIDYEKNKGKGGALRSAMEVSASDYVMYTDWDIPYTDASMLAVLEELRDGADAVFAIRGKQSYMKVIPLGRKILSRLSHFINCALLRLPNTDTQGGLKGMNRQGKERFLKTKINRFLFDTEFIALCVRAGLDVRSVRADIRPGLSSSHYSPRTLMRELPGLWHLLRARWFS